MAMIKRGSKYTAVPSVVGVNGVLWGCALHSDSLRRGILPPTHPKLAGTTSAFRPQHPTQAPRASFPQESLLWVRRSERPTERASDPGACGLTAVGGRALGPSEVSGAYAAVWLFQERKEKYSKAGGQRAGSWLPPSRLPALITPGQAGQGGAGRAPRSGPGVTMAEIGTQLQAAPSTPGSGALPASQKGPPRWVRAGGRATAPPGTLLRPAPRRPRAPPSPVLTLQTAGCSQAEGEESQGDAAVLPPAARQRPHEQARGDAGRAWASLRRGAARARLSAAAAAAPARPPASGSVRVPGATCR